MKEIKESEGGSEGMCEIWDKLIKIERLDVILELVKKGKLTLEEAAEELHITVEEVKNKMQEFGYTSPV